MSSTPNTSTDAPSSRVQSASNKTKEETSIENTNVITEKTSRPPSALQKTAADTSGAPVIAASAVEREEPVLSTVNSSDRPPSANQKSTTDTSTELRPGSALKTASQDITNRPPSAAKVDLPLDSTTIESKTSRPPSANQKTDEQASHGYSITTTHFRPPSASQKADESTTTINSRPPSASLKTDESTIKTPTSSRPPSASQKANEPTTNAPIGSRPPSANQKSNDLDTVPVGSRPSTASHNTDVTNVSESINITAPTSSRPSSANQKPDLTTSRTGSRPPSARQTQDETNAGDSTTEQQNTLVLFNSNDPNITQPIIGRPPSAMNKVPTDESNITAPPNTLTENGLSSDENKPIESTPRIGSATKNLLASTTTENNS